MVLLLFSLQAPAQQKAEKYAGYSPSTKADSHDRKAQKKKSRRAKEAQAKSAKRSKAVARSGAVKQPRDAVAKNRTAAKVASMAGSDAGKRTSAAKRSSTAKSKGFRVARAGTARSSASGKRVAAAAKAGVRVSRAQRARVAELAARAGSTRPSLQAGARSTAPASTRAAAVASAPITPPVLRIAPSLAQGNLPPLEQRKSAADPPGAGAASSRSASAQSGTSAVAAWAGVPLLTGALGAFLYFRRRALAEAEPPILQIDPTLDVSSADVAQASRQVKADLMQRAEPFFVDLRSASVRKDHEYILQHCTEDMATTLILDSVVAESPATTRVEGLKAELVDLFEEVNRYVASVQYTAHEQLGDRRPRKVNEVWHFVRDPDGPDWRLAAVEPA